MPFLSRAIFLVDTEPRIMVSSPAGIGEMMHKALTVAVGGIGVPFLRASTTTAVVGWPHPQMSSHRHVPHEFAASGLATSPQCSVFQQYPALQLLLDPVQWPPIGHRAHMLEAVQNTSVDTTRPSCGDSLTTAGEQRGPRISMVHGNKTCAKDQILNQKGSEEQNSLLAESLTSVVTRLSSQLPSEVDEATVGSSVAEKRRVKRSRRHNAQSSQILELRQRLRAQKLLSVKAELQHGQRSALRAWAAECKRARAAVAHRNELDMVTSHMVDDSRELEERLESASTKFALQISRLESVVQCSQKELQERRLLVLSPWGRRWRLQRVALQFWAAACAQSKKSGLSQEPRNGTKKRRSRTPLPMFAPPLPFTAEVAKSSLDGERQIGLVTGSPTASATGPEFPPGLDICGCDRTWGCMHQQTYSKGVMLLHKGMAQQVARGPPGLSLGAGGEPRGEQRDAHQFKLIPYH